LEAVSNGSSQSLKWDATGNLIFHKNHSEQEHFERFLCWDEQNRLQGVVDENYLSYYQYDANGDRTFKLTGKGDLQNISGSWQYYYTLNNATLYASPYLVATDKGYTKHYYAEGERIASKIGGGGLAEFCHLMLHGETFVKKMEANSTMMDKMLLGCLDVKYYDVKPFLQHLSDWRDSVQPERDCYWYHPDHLGSSSWITDSAGHTIQHLYYLPWGEDFINQKLSGFDGVRHTFSAKEKDAETGLSYFGARYYSSDLSIWLSVDPMSDKYPSLSPYVYCADNPVKLVDPNGEKIRIYYWNGNRNKYIKYTPGMKVRKRYDAFVKDVINGLNFLYDHPDGDKNRVGFLAKSKIVLDIYQQTAVDQPSKYSGERRELLWDNKHIDIYEEGSQSPVVGLAHEIDHADRSIDAWEKLYECEDSKEPINCDQYVDRAYSRDEEGAETSAIEYENFIGRQLYDGKKVSSYQRKEYIPPILQIEAKTIFSIVE
jgi:RHS repeat-associated protein